MKSKETYIGILLFFSIMLKAQEHRKMSFSAVATYQQLDEIPFYGALIDFAASEPIRTFIRPGLKTGFLYGSLKGSGHTKFNLGPAFQNPSLNYKLEGNIFLIPAGGYVLIGTSEDFLELGMDLQLLQFIGTFQFDMENQRYVYAQSGYSILANFSVGYRHQPVHRGAVFGIFWKPATGLTGDMGQNGFAISLGYAF